MTQFTPEQNKRAGQQYDWNHVSMHCLNWLIEDIARAIADEGPATPQMMEMACVARFAGQHNVLAAIEAIGEGILPSLEDAKPIIPNPPLPRVNEGGGGK